MEGTDQQDSSSFVWGSMKTLTNYFAQSNAAKKELTAKPFCVPLGIYWLEPVLLSVEIL